MPNDLSGKVSISENLGATQVLAEQYQVSKAKQPSLASVPEREREAEACTR